ncbi:hypothetical protein KZZ52_47240 [Dactylosporangium sp. AC04546]|nr:hypothetical protein [Dactylosporangium sp. AC04546]WVK81509.1 hypothetical protein KZZ52_47240 [Dactylosporangium sp. AC04546]
MHPQKHAVASTRVTPTMPAAPAALAGADAPGRVALRAFSSG